MRVIHWVRIEKFIIFWTEQNTTLLTINLKYKITKI
jgi:hypothetical protein